MLIVVLIATGSCVERSDWGLYTSHSVWAACHSGDATGTTAASKDGGACAMEDPEGYDVGLVDALVASECVGPAAYHLGNCDDVIRDNFAICYAEAYESAFLAASVDCP